MQDRHEDFYYTFYFRLKIYGAREWRFSNETFKEYEINKRNCLAGLQKKQN